MLTKSKSKLGEGELVEGDLEIGSRRTFSRTMSSPQGEEEGLSSKDAKVKKEEKGKGVGGDGDPLETTQTFSSSHCS